MALNTQIALKMFWQSSSCKFTVRAMPAAKFSFLTGARIFDRVYKI